MTFCVLSERDVLAKMKKAENKNYMLTVVADLTGYKREEMAEWLRGQGFNVEVNGRSSGLGKVRY